MHQQGGLADGPVAEQRRVFGLTLPGALDASLEGSRWAAVSRDRPCTYGEG